MSPFHYMQLLVATLVVLNILDIVTTSYAIRMKMAYEGNSVVARVMQWIGTTLGGLLVVKVPGFLMAGMAMFPQFFAALHTPTWLLVWIADTSTTSWWVQIGIYAVVVGNNLRIVMAHWKKEGRL